MFLVQLGIPWAVRTHSYGTRFPRPRPTYTVFRKSRVGEDSPLLPSRNTTLVSPHHGLQTTFANRKILRRLSLYLMWFRQERYPSVG
jgi:hypothetical protein